MIRLTCSFKLSGLSKFQAMRLWFVIWFLRFANTSSAVIGRLETSPNSFSASSVVVRSCAVHTMPSRYRWCCVRHRAALQRGRRQWHRDIAFAEFSANSLC
jgi:hypothetical protein